MRHKASVTETLQICQKRTDPPLNNNFIERHMLFSIHGSPQAVAAHSRHAITAAAAGGEPAVGWRAGCAGAAHDGGMESMPQRDWETTCNVINTHGVGTTHCGS